MDPIGPAAFTFAGRAFYFATQEGAVDALVAVRTPHPHHTHSSPSSESLSHPLPVDLSDRLLVFIRVLKSILIWDCLCL